MVSRIITGVIIILIGIIVIVFSFFSSYFNLIYGIPLLIIGIIIFFNKNEDNIEQIKNKKEVKK